MNQRTTADKLPVLHESHAKYTWNDSKDFNGRFSKVGTDSFYKLLTQHWFKCRWASRQWNMVCISEEHSTAADVHQQFINNLIPNIDLHRRGHQRLRATNILERWRSFSSTLCTFWWAQELPKTNSSFLISNIVSSLPRVLYWIQRLLGSPESSTR